MTIRQFSSESAQLPTKGSVRAIESDSFPFEYISEIAEQESWRKEIHRPIYHVHKWWAKRLGSVFRAVVLGAALPDAADILDRFYSDTRLDRTVVFDPFMGSGTTVGEALKLGARAIGRDINPVAHFLVRNALRPHEKGQVLSTFQSIEADLKPRISDWYRCRLPSGGEADVLYFFWVKTVPCPDCEASVDLFRSRVFARHAYPKRNPEARAVCPHCGSVERVRYDSDETDCSGCGRRFDPQTGPARRTKATCPRCSSDFRIAAAARSGGGPPDHRLYAKLVLRPDGEKDYLPADDFDRELYREAGEELAERHDGYPEVEIAPGHNTNQVLNYGYTHWHQMFNNRQLLCLGMLAERIESIEPPRLRELFTCLFSGTLEFNNMFASYKGEGTGAVRHMFSHHVLKPERTPLEAHPWGTSKSSGAFSTLFESRILRALDYQDRPFEIRVVPDGEGKTSEKVFGLSESPASEPAEDYEEFAEGKRLYLSCGDSASTDLPDRSVDVVVTDPPFFDNVHYSELADFFFVWQRHILGGSATPDSALEWSTRSPDEVQETEASEFSERLAGVWRECHRVLKDDGLLVFTYHHSRTEGWSSLLEALTDANFVVSGAVPVKSEMSVATPKSQAGAPIDIDIVFSCRKAETWSSPGDARGLVEEARSSTEEQLSRFNEVGRKLGRSDIEALLHAHTLRLLSQRPGEDALPDFGSVALTLFEEQAASEVRPGFSSRQLELL